MRGKHADRATLPQAVLDVMFVLLILVAVAVESLLVGALLIWTFLYWQPFD